MLERGILRSHWVCLRRVPMFEVHCENLIVKYEHRCHNYILHFWVFLISLYLQLNKKNRSTLFQGLFLSVSIVLSLSFSEKALLKTWGVTAWSKIMSWPNYQKNGELFCFYSAPFMLHLPFYDALLQCKIHESQGQDQSQCLQPTWMCMFYNAEVWLLGVVFP